MKFNAVDHTIFYVTLSCGEHYVALPSSPRGIYNIYYVCQDCDDLMYITSKSMRVVPSFFEELEKDFR